MYLFCSPKKIYFCFIFHHYQLQLKLLLAAGEVAASEAINLLPISI